MRYVVLLLSFIIIAILTSCLPFPNFEEIYEEHQLGSSINEIPMYGGAKFTPQQQEANEQFIEQMVNRAGSREKASEKSAELGWYYYYKNRPRIAMKRFNQAWLLNPDNAHAYWGFGLLSAGYGKEDQAIEMLEKALSLDPNNTRLLGDVANSYVEKAKTLSKASQETKMEFFQRAERLFIKAEQLKPDKCTYAQWAVLSYYQGDFEKCLEKARRANELDQGNKECEFVKRYGEECRDKLD